MPADRHYHATAPGTFVEAPTLELVAAVGTERGFELIHRPDRNSTPRGSGVDEDGSERRRGGLRVVSDHIDEPDECLRRCVDGGKQELVVVARAVGQRGEETPGLAGARGSTLDGLEVGRIPLSSASM